jgi:hypothetical protein
MISKLKTLFRRFFGDSQLEPPKISKCSFGIIDFKNEKVYEGYMRDGKMKYRYRGVLRKNERKIS